MNVVVGMFCPLVFLFEVSFKSSQSFPRQIQGVESSGFTTRNTQNENESGTYTSCSYSYRLLTLEQLRKT